MTDLHLLLAGLAAKTVQRFIEQTDQTDRATLILLASVATAGLAAYLSTITAEWVANLLADKSNK